MLDFLKNNPLVDGARGAKLRPRNLLFHLLLFYLVEMVVRLVSAVPSIIYSTFRTVLLLGEDVLLVNDPERTEELLKKMDELLLAVAAEDGYILTSLFSTVLMLLLVVVFCRFIERRPIASMGLSFGRRSVAHYGLGLLVGLALISLTFLVLYLTRAIEVSSGSFSPVFLILYLFGFLIQGAAEEVLLRGYFMVSVTNVSSPLTAVFFSAFVFTMLHVANVGISVLGILNIFLFGILLGFIVFRTRSLYLSMALHGIFNFAEGNLFGFPVSGIVTGHSVLRSAVVDGRSLTHGGAFGPEGGAALTVILLIAIAVFLLIPQKKQAEPIEGDGNAV